MAAALSAWSFEPVPIIGCGLAALLYGLGRRSLSGERSGAAAAAFCTGLALLLVALMSPLDGLDLQYQWVHMAQHVVLLLVAPPLILLGDPVRTMWRGVRRLRPQLPEQPRAWRALRTRLHSGPLSAALITLLFCADMFAWHIPALYNLTLGNEAVHDLEHTLFLLTGLLFWDQVIATDRASGRLSLLARSGIVLAGMLAGWALAVVIGYASKPLYAYPASPDLSALSDQQIAAGVMWVPGSLPFVVALAYLGKAWFNREDAEAQADTVQPAATME